jgi:hypothetical protein
MIRSNGRGWLLSRPPTRLCLIGIGFSACAEGTNLDVEVISISVLSVLNLESLRVMHLSTMMYHQLHYHRPVCWLKAEYILNTLSF